MTPQRCQRGPQNICDWAHQNRHFLNVLGYFMARDNLHVVNIEREGAFDPLSHQLEMKRLDETIHNRTRYEPDPNCVYEPLPEKYRVILAAVQ